MTAEKDKTAEQLVSENSQLRRTVDVLRESEERYRAVAETTTAAIGIVDSEETFIFANPAFTRLLGYDQDELLGMNLSAFIDPDEYKHLRQETELRKQGRVSTYECMMRCKDGTEKILLISASPVMTDNHFKGTLAVVIDISDRKKAEEEVRALNETLEQRVVERTEQLRQSEEQLHQAEKMRAIGQLAGGIAHDFNNQLVGIMGCADLLRTSLVNNESLYEFANIIVKATQRCSQLTKQLLAFARKGKYQSIPVNIHTIIGEVIAILEHSIDKNIIIKQHLDAQEPVVNGDPTQLQNIFLNLALNARDAMRAGGELILLTRDRELDTADCASMPFKIEPGQVMEISVTDTGTGMDTQTKNRIFEPFFTTKEKGKGTGMGLAAVYGAVRNHKGAVTVNSEVGRGTTITIYLPVTKQREPASAEKIKSVETSQTASLLLIDDEKIVADTTTRILQSQGFTVTVYTSGTEAVDFYRKSWQTIDCVIIDIIMPRMNGREVFFAMREINPNVKVLLASGFSLDGEAQKIIDEGAACFIQKPFQITELLEKISETLHKR